MPKNYEQMKCIPPAGKLLSQYKESYVQIKESLSAAKGVRLSIIFSVKELGMCFSHSVRFHVLNSGWTLSLFSHENHAMD